VDVWPERIGHDTGIDLARERDTGNLVAVQCKFYDPATTLYKQHIDTFLSESGKHPFTGRLVVSTTDKWGPNAEAAIHNQQIPVQRIGLTDLLDSSIDWNQFDPNAPGVPELTVNDKRALRTYQREALEKVRAGLAEQDRGKLIMTCGTGKTFTSLQIALDQVRPGGSVLFLVPSIALLSQTLKEWSIEAGDLLRTFAVCFDPKVGKGEEDITTVDLPIPATTAPQRLATAMLRHDPPRCGAADLGGVRDLPVDRRGRPRPACRCAGVRPGHLRRGPPHHRRHPGGSGRVGVRARARRAVPQGFQAPVHDRDAANLRRQLQSEGRSRPTRCWRRWTTSPSSCLNGLGSAEFRRSCSGSKGRRAPCVPLMERPNLELDLLVVVRADRTDPGYCDRAARRVSSSRSG
jgi:hypothetical protein